MNTIKHYGDDNLGFAAARRNRADRAAQAQAVTKLAVLRLMTHGAFPRKKDLMVHLTREGVMVRDQTGKTVPVTDYVLGKALRDLVADGRLIRSGSGSYILPLA